MTKKLHAKLASPLLMAFVAIGLSAFWSAHALAADPGQNDPVGPPANYITLRNDNLAIGTYVSTRLGRGKRIKFDTLPGDLSSPDALFSAPSLFSKKVGSGGSDNSVTVAGRILFQHREELVSVGRSVKVPNAAIVRFRRGDGYVLKDLHNRLKDVPDQISAAVGDLDKVPDAEGANHEELVVAYANNSGQVNMAVLNYTSTALGCGKRKSGKENRGSCPKYVTTTVAPFKVNFASIPAPVPTDGDQQGIKVSEVLALAIGDFDGDGQNEIALATLGPVKRNSVNLAVFRYVHPTLSATPALKLVTQTTLFDFGDDGVRSLVPTLSLAAGDFDGTGRADLIVATRIVAQADLPTLWTFNNDITAYRFDTNLNPTARGFFPRGFEGAADPVALDTLTPGRIICLPGLVKYDPGNGYHLYRRGVVVLYNDILPADNDAGALLRIGTYVANTDPDDPSLLDWTGLGNTDSCDNDQGSCVGLPNQGIGASFAATLGAFGVHGDINNPVWSLAVAQLGASGPGGAPQKPGLNQQTVSVFQNINGAGIGPDPIAQTSFNSECAFVCNSATQNQLRPAIQAYDYQAETILLGAPIKITLPKVISTDFVLQDPPKHTYWDEVARNLVVVSRNPGFGAGTNVSLMNKNGDTYTSKSTDTTGSSVGGSEAATASASISTNVLGIFGLKLGVDVTSKATYNYTQNQASYNSNYSSRLLTDTESTAADDFVSGRFQKLTIWRYRVLGETSPPDATGKTQNLYYDVVFPGPSLAFKASGLDLDWYQPIHEPGNILSYPAPVNGTFGPSDIGTYAIPCPAGASDCLPNGTKVRTGPLIPPQEEFLSGTSGSITLDYTNTTGSGNQISYQKTLGTSLDVKVSYSASVAFIGGEGGGSFATNFNSDNNWGNTTTADSTSTGETAITISRAAIPSSEGYAFYPTLYTTLDGTIKAAFAADPLGSDAGRSFWARLYGALPDPALNLPLRFSLNGLAWGVNDQTSRKQMRGFFVLSADPDPVTGQYVILGPAPTRGDKVRLSAQVNNYSTAKSFTNCSVQFYAIKYDSDSDTETGTRQLIGQTTISLAPRATAPAQIIWDTTGFGPANGTGSQDYRIYVDLNYDKKIQETYAPEDPNKVYAPGLAKGVDPGQNDEGFGLATVMAPPPAGPAPARAQDASSSDNNSSPAVTFSSTPLAWSVPGRLAGKLATNDLIVGAGMPVRLRAQVCSTADSRDPVNVVVFDGEPSGGKVIAWKRIYVPGNGQCESTWFNWKPTHGQHNLVATIDPTATPSTVSNNAALKTEAALMTESSPQRASLHVQVP